MAKKTNTSVRMLIPMQGQWLFKGDGATYVGPDAHGVGRVGVCLSSTKFRSGHASVKARFLTEATAARIVLGFNAATGSYYSVGLGGYNFAYLVDAFVPGQGWQALESRGDISQLKIGRDYNLQVEVMGQQISLSVDGVRVIETALRSPLQGDQVGLFAWGESEVQFHDFHLSGSESRIFVVMQFGEQFDALYKDVIQPVSSKLGFKAFRADDVFRPGVILQDIRRGIVESDVIVAEITPANPNVFYELGYAHALEKPTVLLANKRTEKLPFDVSGYRVIFYDDTIGGKREVESTLYKHLASIRKGDVPHTGEY